jgi:hypothetical protein
MITISGGIFNFENSYIPTTWSGSTYDFEKIVIYHIYSDNLFTFAACNLGLNIYDISSEKLYAYVNISSGINTVAGNDSKIYLGTTNSGIKYINKTCISGSIDNPFDLTTCLLDLNTKYITSSGIKYLHCKDNYLGVCTNSGVDYFRFNTNPEIHSKSFLFGAGKCFILKDTIYYTTSGINPVTSGIQYNLHRNDTCLTDWSSPTKTYTTGSGIFQEGIKLTDLYITEGTAVRGGNTIFCATTSGIYAIDEDTKEHAIYYTRN